MRLQLDSQAVQLQTYSLVDSQAVQLQYDSQAVQLQTYSRVDSQAVLETELVPPVVSRR